MSTTDLAPPARSNDQRPQTAIEARAITETPHGGSIEVWAQDNERPLRDLNAFPDMTTGPAYVVEGVNDLQASRSMMRVFKNALDQPLVMQVTVATVAQPFFAKPFSETIDAALRFKARYWREQPVDRTHARPASPPSRAYRTFKELMGLLSANQSETAALVGLSRGAVDQWRRGREPQPRNARRLYRTHTLLKTLSRRLGHAELQHWLDTGAPTPRELLRADELAIVDSMASELIFTGPAPASERVGAYVDELEIAADSDTGDDTSAAPTPRRVKRRAPRRRAK